MSSFRSPHELRDSIEVTIQLHSKIISFWTVPGEPANSGGVAINLDSKEEVPRDCSLRDGLPIGGKIRERLTDVSG